MFRREKTIALKSSASALCNNLSVLIDSAKNNVTCAVVHRSVVNFFSVANEQNYSTESSPQSAAPTHGQVACKETTSASNLGSSIVLQGKLVKLNSRNLLVISSQRWIQMFEPDGTAMLFCHSLADPNSQDAINGFARGICALGGDKVCVGTCGGGILVFQIPPKGSNFILLEELRVAKVPICDVASHDEILASGDDNGDINVQQHSAVFKQKAQIPGSGFPCSCIAVWKDIVAGGYGSGHIRLYDAMTGRIGAEVTAHAQWITAMDISLSSGLLISASEDSFVRVWQLKCSEVPEIEHKFSEQVKDQALVGAAFTNKDGKKFAVSGYDYTEVTFFTS